MPKKGGWSRIRLCRWGWGAYTGPA